MEEDKTKEDSDTAEKSNGEKLAEKEVLFFYNKELLYS